MLSLLFALVISVGAQEKFDVNDVSFLFPIESREYVSQNLLRLSINGKFGPLLSADVFRIAARDAFNYDNYAVTAVRFEPCTEGDKDDPSNCKSELRLTAQRFDDFYASNSLSDGLHLIYGIDESELQEVLSRLRQLKVLSPVKTSGVPLGVHPALKAGDISGIFYKKLIRLVLDFAGEKKLIRIARSNDSASSEWFFRAMLFQNGKVVPDSIPNINSDQIRLSLFIDNVNHGVDGDIEPLPKTPVTILPLFERLQDIEASIRDGSFFVPGNRFAMSAEHAVKLENPMFGAHRLNTDCVSCHMAEPVVDVAAKIFDDMKTGRPFPWRFANLKFELSGYTLMNKYSQRLHPDSIVAFGYTGTDVTIIQRVINESAIVADWINRHQ